MAGQLNENVTAFHESDSGWLAFESSTVAKLVSMAMLGLGSFALGVLPLKIMALFKKCQTDTYWLDMVEMHEATDDLSLPSERHGGHSHGAEPRFATPFLSFGGGVLLFTAIMHLLPEVRESAKHLQEDGLLPDCPALAHLGDLIFCFGFFAVFLLEELVQLVLARFVASSLSPLRSLFALFALSLHEVFEGTAIGLQTAASDVWYLSVAVAAHKLIIAFCLGLDMVTSGVGRLWLVLSVATFSFVTPVGISVGMLFVSDTGDGPFTVILQGLATGTLLYVVFFEVLASHKRRGFLSFVFAASGFLVMYAVQIYFGEYHVHGHTPTRILLKTDTLFFPFVRLCPNGIKSICYTKSSTNL